MFKNMKLGARIGFGFALLIVLACALGGVAIWQMTAAADRATALADRYAPEVDYASNLSANIGATGYNMRGFTQTFDQKQYETASTAFATAGENLKSLADLVSKHPQLVKLAEALPGLNKSYSNYKGAMEATHKNVGQIVNAQKALDEAAAAFVTRIEELQSAQDKKLRDDIQANVGQDKLVERATKIENVAAVRNAMNQVRIAAWKMQAERDASIFESALPKFDEISAAFETLRPITHQPEDIAALDACQAQSKNYKERALEIVAAFKENAQLNTVRRQSLTEIQDATAALCTTAVEQTTSNSTDAKTGLHFATTILYVGLASAAIIGALLGYFITRGITRPVNRIITALGEGSNQVEDAARQVSSASQQLAAGASEQASSLEETSSALEQMAAMTRTNASNAEKANDLAGQARKNADEGEKTMGDLNNAMTAINDSAAQIGKIIKVIEEIAFQTNLLALNAAVEAARAGEMGKGFAVVAEEVRNLAQRSAQAARDTTNLIEGAVTRAKEGTTVASSAAKSLQAIVSDVANVAELLAGISKASNEQAQGVEQINTAVSQMDKVTQQNAAGAEESASAAEQLSAQAQTVKGVVNELASLVGQRTTTGAGSAHYAPPPKSKIAAPKTHAPKSHANASSKSYSNEADAQFSKLADTASSYDGGQNDSGINSF